MLQVRNNIRIFNFLDGGLVFCKIIESMPQDYLQKKFKSIVGDFLSMDEDIKISTYPDFIQLMSRVNLKDSEIKKFSKLIPQVNNFEKYVECLPHFLSLFSKHSDKIKRKELSMLTFEHLNKEMNLAKSATERFEKLDNLFKKMIASKTDITELLTFEPFLNLLHYPKKRTKLSLIMGVLKELNKSQNVVLNDPVLAYTILELVASLTRDRLFEDVNTQSEALEEQFVKFVRRVDFGKNVEESLNFITKVRSELSDTFTSLNERMVYKALGLIESTFKWSKGKFKRQIIDFVQGCCAFAYISLVDLPSKKIMHIALHIAQVTLQSGYSSLTEAVLVKLIEHIEKKLSKINKKYQWEERLAIYDQFKGLISMILILPDNPETDHFLTVKNFMAIIEKKQPEGENKLLLLDLYSHLIRFYATHVSTPHEMYF